MSEQHNTQHDSRLVIAIDGPSGSGKSTIAKHLARHFGLGYLDTGAMYRALCWFCLENGTDTSDSGAVAADATQFSLDISLNPDDFAVHVGGVDVTAAIRESRIAENVSAVASVPVVRKELISRQRQLIQIPPTGCVAEGRDITTVVAPDADLRVLLIADEQSRVVRRARQVHGSTSAEAVASTEEQVAGRDARDSRTTHFMTAADGVMTVDSSKLSIEQTVEVMLDLVDQAKNRRNTK